MAVFKICDVHNQQAACAIDKHVPISHVTNGLLGLISCTETRCRCHFQNHNNGMFSGI